MTNSNNAHVWRADHFEPNDASDPKMQRHVHGTLEQIDVMAYDANRNAIAAQLGHVKTEQFEKLAAAAAQARCRWAAAAVALASSPEAPGKEQMADLAVLRENYNELAEAYAGLRRMVERSYLRL